MFYLAEVQLCKAGSGASMFGPFDCVVLLYSLCRGRALQSDPWPMTRGWLSRKYPAYLGTERCVGDRHFQTKALEPPDIVALETFGTDSVEVVAA